MSFATAREVVAPQLEKLDTSASLPIVFTDNERAIMKLYDIEIQIDGGELYLSQSRDGDLDAVIFLAKEQVEMVAKLMIEVMKKDVSKEAL